jgi:hypothetical protein
MTTTTWRLAAFSATTVIVQQLYMGRAVAGLSVALGLAFAVWLVRPPRPGWRPDRVLAVFMVGIAVQVAHFIEEWTTGFAREFPALLGYEWSDGKFVVFNAAWLSHSWSRRGGRRRSSGALVVGVGSVTGVGDDSATSDLHERGTKSVSHHSAAGTGWRRSRPVEPDMGSNGTDDGGGAVLPILVVLPLCEHPTR